MTLQELRKEIEIVDRELLRLIKARMDIAVRIASEKSAAGLPTRDEDRAAQVLECVTREAETYGLDVMAVSEIYAALIRMSEDLQDQRRR